MVEKQVTIKVDTKYGQTGSPSTMTQGLDQTMKKMSASAGTLQKYANLSGLTMGQVQEGFSDIMKILLLCLTVLVNNFFNLVKMLCLILKKLEIRYGVML